MIALAVCAHPAMARSADLLERIDRFVEGERLASGIPGIAVAIVQEGQAVHAQGFGHDGRGRPIGPDTPFPIGSLTKSFTALLVRQAIDAGQLDADAPVRRYLPWFQVADAGASPRLTLRHLLNQTSGFSRGDGIAPLLEHSRASIDEVSRGLAAVSLNRPVGERFEYSNLNFVLLGAVLEAVTGRPWQHLIHARVFQPLAMGHSHTDHDAARQAGMTALHRMWFGFPVAQEVELLPGFAPTGSLVSSASDMARYLQMLLAGGQGPAGPVLSVDGVTALLTPASPPARARLLSAEFEFRYAEGWFVGPFGAARDARWHLGNLASFAAWMVLLPETKQAVVVLINANSELPFGDVNAVMSRVPIGVVNLLLGEEVRAGPSLRRAYVPFVGGSIVAVLAASAVAWRAAGARRHRWSVALLLLAASVTGGLHMTGLSLPLLGAFAPDAAVVLAATLALLCLPAAWRAGAGLRRLVAATGDPRQR